jgi:hypothetical protein
MSKELGFGKRRLIAEIIKQTWDVENPYDVKLGLNDILFIIQEMNNDEGRIYLEGNVNKTSKFDAFRYFAKHLLYRNLANFDSMVLLTSEKGCLTDDTLIEMPRDLIKYPKGVPIKDLIDKGSFYVYSYNIKTKQLELKLSDGVEFVKKSKVCTIKTKDGFKLTGTFDHPVLTFEGKYKHMIDLNVKDKECIVTNQGIKQVVDRIIEPNECNVYDIMNVRDNHNFIANGFVVSNSGKSSFAILLARAWCQLLGMRFDPNRHIAYSNKDVMNKVDSLKKFEPLICDEGVRFMASADWARKEHKELRKKIAEVRTKHLLFVMCFPLKVSKIEKNWLDSFVNYWCDIFGRGYGSIFVKDRNPVNDPWRLTDFKNIGSYTEFTKISDIEKKLKKHPNFWQIIQFPKPPKWLYDKYLLVREHNVYNEDIVRDMVTPEDVNKALLLLALQDIMMNDSTFSLNRITFHIKNRYDIPIAKKSVQDIMLDSKQLITKIREEQIARKDGN